MTQLPGWVTKVQVVWIALGTFLSLLVAQGVDLPDFLPALLSGEFAEKTIAAITYVFTFFQYVKGIFVVTPAPPSASITTMSAGKIQNYAFNPFQIRLSA